MTANHRYQIARTDLQRQSRLFSAPVYMLGGVAAFTASLFLVLPMSDIRGILGLGYLLQTAAYIALNQSRHRYALIRLLQPSMISLIYIGLNCALGAWAFNSGNIVNMIGASDYHSWRNLQQVYIVLSSCLLALYLVSLRDLGLPKYVVSLSSNSNNVGASITFPLIFLFFCLLASTALTFSILSQTKTLVSAVIIYLLFRHENQYKWVLVALVIGILVSASAHSKREAIFVLPAICLLVLSYYPLEKATLPKIIFGILAVALVAVLVLAMSIIRGYGSFDAHDIVEAALYIPQYLDLQNSVGFILNNFEVSYIFLHTHNCISFALRAGAELSHGDTYIRALLIGPIGDLTGYKPASIVDQYTGTLFPGFRAVGGSFGVTSIGEAVWNFGFLAPIAIVLIYLGLDSFFAWLVELMRSLRAWSTVFAVTAFQCLLYFARGSGLDLILIYMIFFAVTGFLFTVPLKVLRLDCGKSASRQSTLRYSPDPTT